LAVRVDAVPIEGWWYEGAGIYRHVWLVKTSAIHVATYGVFVNPVRNPDGTWDTEVETTLENTSDASVSCRLMSQVLNADAGEPVQNDAELAPRSRAVVHQTIRVNSPRLWSLESPNLYQFQTQVRVGAELLDECVTTFGYRAIRFDPEYGFFLN